jgi:hypothetical protein
MNYPAKLNEYRRILNLIEWIVDGVNEVEYPNGYKFFNVTPDTFEDDPDRAQAWVYLTHSWNREFVNQVLWDIHVGTEEGIHYEETVFYQG